MKQKYIIFPLLVILILALPLAALWAITTQPYTLAKKQDFLPKSSPEALKDHVVTLSTKLPPRDIDTDNLDKTVAYIKQHFAQVASPYEQEYDVMGIPYRNLGITLGPKSKQRIVIGAHFDSVEGQPGADDNASGVAGLIELAKLLKGKKLNRSVELMAYTLEEPPYFATNEMGSYVHAKKLKEQGVDVILMVSLEMIGYFTDEPNSQKYPISLLKYFYPTQGNFIAVVSNLSGIDIVRRTKTALKGASSLPVYSINTVPLMTGINFSDHMNFWIHDYPALMITDTAFFRNPHYHTNKDTWEKLDYNRMAEVVNGVYAVVMSFANRVE